MLSVVPVLQLSDVSGATPLGHVYPVVPAVAHGTFPSGAHTVVIGAAPVVSQQYWRDPPDWTPALQLSDASNCCGGALPMHEKPIDGVMHPPTVES